MYLRLRELGFCPTRGTWLGVFHPFLYLQFLEDRESHIQAYIIVHGSSRLLFEFQVGHAFPDSIILYCRDQIGTGLIGRMW